MTSTHTIGIMQPYLFPYLGYFQLLRAVDQFVIYDDVQYIKGGWINRNNLWISGAAKRFTIELSGASPNRLINEIDIRDNFRKFLTTIATSYARAPHYHAVYNLLSDICAHQDRNLARFTGHSIRTIAAYLGLDCTFLTSSDIPKDAALKGQDKVIAICSALHATRYVNAIGGQELYQHADFERHGITLQFLKPELAAYPQPHVPFVPALSIIDVMMFNSVRDVGVLLDNYALI